MSSIEDSVAEAAGGQQMHHEAASPPDTDSMPRSTISMVTVRLSDSEPSGQMLESATYDHPIDDPDTCGDVELAAVGINHPACTLETELEHVGASQARASKVSNRSATIHAHFEDIESVAIPETSRVYDSSRRGSTCTTSSEGGTSVNWEGLEKTEEQEAKDDGSDEVA